MVAKLHSLFQPIQANGRVTTNQYVEILPSPMLRPYVSCYWASEPTTSSKSRDNSCETIDRVLPDGCTDIMFEHDTEHNIIHIRFCGVFDHSFNIVYNEKRPVRKFAVRFFPSGAYSFIKTSLAEFTNQLLNIDLIWPSTTRQIAEQIFMEESLDKKILIMENYLISILQQSGNVQDNLLSNLLYRIFVTKGGLSVRELAESEGISARQMNRKFDQWIGVSPKKFCEIVRFQSIVREIQSKQTHEWRMLALKHGYFDQAHMIHDFKRFYGDTPMIAAKEYQMMSDFYN